LTRRVEGRAFTGYDRSGEQMPPALDCVLESEPSLAGRRGAGKISLGFARAALGKLTDCCPKLPMFRVREPLDERFRCLIGDVSQQISAVQELEHIGLEPR
jgi:hypothetical protein